MPEKPNIKIILFFLTISVLLTCLFPATSIAHNNVVVIPMAGDNKPLEPFAPLAASSPRDSSYSISPSLEVVDDYITGLEWQKAAGHETKNWDDAWNYCRLLNLYGYGWRLPSVSELMSIVHYGSRPSINRAAFPATWENYYWSASSLGSFSNNAWRVGFSFGHVDAASKDTAHITRCVRSSRPTGPVLQDNNNFTVTDLATGLTWQQGDDSGGETWEYAHLYCLNLKLGNKSDWRLPNVKELASIVDYRQRFPAIGEVMSTLGVDTSYWSETVYHSDNSKAWRIAISSGSAGPVNKTNSYQVRCVR